MNSPSKSLVGALADRYELLRELGAGGMATVYLAEDVRHRRKVALKVLRPELAAVIGAARFLKEIETTANLQHPHILPLHDSGEVDGTGASDTFLLRELRRTRYEPRSGLPAMADLSVVGAGYRDNKFNRGALSMGSGPLPRAHRRHRPSPRAVPMTLALTVSNCVRGPHHFPSLRPPLITFDG